MRYKLLGPSGLRVSEICLGTMSFGDVWGFGADEKESQRILGAYAEAGGNFIATANKYHEGQSEEIVGSFLGTGRDRWVVATKYTLAMRSGDPNSAGNSRKNMRESGREACGVREPTTLISWEVMRGLDDLVSAGKVNYVALSDAPAWIASQANTLALLRGWSPFVALQFEYSLIERTGERELLPVAEAFGLSVTPGRRWAPACSPASTPAALPIQRRTPNALQATSHVLLSAISRSPGRWTVSPTSSARPRRKLRSRGYGSAANGTSRSWASASSISSRTSWAAWK